MASGSGSADFFDMSSSMYDDEIEFERSSSDTILEVTVEETTETKDWVLPSSDASEPVNDVIIDEQPVVGVKSFFQEDDTDLTVNGNVSIEQDDLCQDDMFSLDELSAVEDRTEQLGVETTVSIANVATSVVGDDYELNLRSSVVDATIPVLGARSEQGLNETDREKAATNMIHGPVDASGQDTTGHLPDIATSNSCSLIEPDTQPAEELIGTSTSERCILGNLQSEAIHLANESVEIDNDQQASKDFENVDTLSEDFPQNELLNSDTDQPTSEVLEKVNVSFEKFPQNESVNNDTDHLTSVLSGGVIALTEEFPKSTDATDNSNEKESKEETLLINEVIINSSEGCSNEGLRSGARDAPNAIACGSELEMEVDKNQHELPAETNDVTNINDVKDEESMQLNQATQPEEFLVQVEDVATKMVASTVLECQSHLKQSQMSVSDEKYFEPSVMKVEVNDTHLKQAEIVAMKEEHGSQHEQDPEMTLMKEEEDSNQNQSENLSVLQTTPGDEQKPKSEDVDEVLPASKKIEESHDVQVCMCDPSAITNELSANATQTEKCMQDTLEQTESMKEEIISVDVNRSCQEEQSQNVNQAENDEENTAKVTSHMSNLQEGTTESHAEHIEDGNGEQREYELLKGRKVSKIFKRRKFMGEVIGYDPVSKWFKVLYEDGDEEELEKHELNAILIPLKGESSVSLKRQLSPTDNELEEPNRSGRKTRKLDIDDTPGRQKKNAMSRDQSSGSRRPSSTKKGKSNAAKSGGKSKSTRTNLHKTQKGKRTVTSSKKSTEKKKTAKKSSSSQTKRQQKSRIKGKSSKNHVKQDSENQNVDDVTRKLKYGTATKKTATSSEQKAKEILKKGKEVETPEVSMITKSEVDLPGRKRKAVSEIRVSSSAVDNKRAKKDKIVKDVELPPEKKNKPRLISEDTPELQSQANVKAESSVPQSSEKRGGSSNRGTILIGRKVEKDFGGKLYRGEVVGYKLFYKVKYEDGDSEDLTWKELESILLSEEDGIVQSKNDQKQHGTKHGSVRSIKGKKKK